MNDPLRSMLKFWLVRYEKNALKTLSEIENNHTIVFFGCLFILFYLYIACKFDFFYNKLFKKRQFWYVMRFLKTKITKANQHFAGHPEACLVNRAFIKPEEHFQKTSDLLKKEEPFEKNSHSESARKAETTKKSPHYDSSKNIVKNYGRAICSFILSDVGVPYLKPMILRERVRLEELRTYISNEKEGIDGISSFRRLLLPNECDEEKVIAYKNILKEMSVIFIKDFSVNWIFSGRLRDKLAHLKCRYKMLRRVLDPSHFTYLKNTL